MSLTPSRPLRALLTALALSCATLAPQANAADRIKVIVDMDIGDDIDDSFALALLLQSPEFDIIGITAAWGDDAS